MAGLSESFRHWLPPSEAETVEAVTNGLVVLDTNVLLDTYRFAAQARTELFGALEKLGQRLWIPHQVALEFHRNRVGVIAEHAATYGEALEAVSESRERLSADLGAKIAQLSSRVALPEDESARLGSLVISGLDHAIEELRRLRDRHGIPEDALKRDIILARLQQLLYDKVGAPLSAEDYEAACTEADRRIKAKTPPGYGDRKKDDPYGDYLLWIQTLREAEKRQTPLLLVTRDVKEDWFWRVAGKTLGARPELVEECLRIAHVPLILMTTRTFLYHAAEHLKTKVSEDTLRQVDALPPPDDSQRPQRLATKNLGSYIEQGELVVAKLSEMEGLLTSELHRLEALSLLSLDDEQTAVVESRINKIAAELERIGNRRETHSSTVHALRRAAERGSGAKLGVRIVDVQRLQADYQRYVQENQE